jgi:muramoyltetrapeptide carboxypeptidase
VLLLEEVAEPTYRIDRMLGQLFQHAGVRRLAGVRMGRFSQVQPNDPDFGRGERDIMEEWCRRAGVPFLGTADIGHDADNKVVPFAGFAA